MLVQNRLNPTLRCAQRRADTQPPIINCEGDIAASRTAPQPVFNGLPAQLHNIAIGILCGGRSNSKESGITSVAGMVNPLHFRFDPGFNFTREFFGLAARALNRAPDADRNRSGKLEKRIAPPATPGVMSQIGRAHV